MADTVTVGIADLNAVKAPDTLVTYALGSCVGVCLYDREKKIAGLAHIMLPHSSEAIQNIDNKRRYADTGIAELIKLMTSMGASVQAMTAKIAGGAKMFSTSSSVFNIGERNIASVKEILAGYGIRIAAEETGLDFGRTVFFHGDTGIMEVRSAMRETKML